MNRGAGCLFQATDTGRLLLQRRAKTSSEGGTWGSWGGGCDFHETPEEALIREVEEEAGIDVRGHPMCRMLVFTNPEDGFEYSNFLVVVPTEFDPTVNYETEGWGWFHSDDLPDPLHFGVEALMKDDSSIRCIEGGYEGLSYLGEMNHSLYYKRKKKAEYAWHKTIEEKMEDVLKEMSSTCGMSISPAKTSLPKRPLSKYRSKTSKKRKKTL